ncbi:hypothetical protein V2O64_22195 [Verrucomicrobiaceae bacterium 227]
MATSLYFQKRDENEEITLEEWNSAIRTVDAVKPDSAPVTAKNPTTGETISISGATGDASLYFEEEKQWIKVFHFFRGKVTFTPPTLYPGESAGTEPVRVACRNLLEQLNDVMISVEGLEWDFS